MKKTAICILAVFLFFNNVCAEENWFVITPAMDSSGELVDKDKYKNVKRVEVKFKIVELIEEILS